jgi:hypothetical protein
MRTLLQAQVIAIVTSTDRRAATFSSEDPSLIKSIRLNCLYDCVNSTHRVVKKTAINTAVL